MRLLLTVMISVISGLTVSYGMDIKLPAPQTNGGQPIFTVLDNRSSQISDLPGPAITIEELATILWAGCGPNRDGKSWTVPLAAGRPPYVKLYVLHEDGAYQYIPQKNTLKEITTANVKSMVGPQESIQNAFFILIVALDGKEMEKFPQPEAAGQFGHITIGAVSQNINLAAQSLGINARFIYNLNQSLLKQSLEMHKKDIPIAFILLGK